MARVRLWGELSPSGRDDLVLRWYNLLPAAQATALLGAAGLTGTDAEVAVTARPLTDRRDLPDVLAAELPI